MDHSRCIQTEREHCLWYINGKRICHFQFNKKKLNPQISTETEIVAVVDCMTDVPWTRYRLDAQGYEVLIILYIKTIKVLLFWKIMARLQAAMTQNT